MQEREIYTSKEREQSPDTREVAESLFSGEIPRDSIAEELKRVREELAFLRETITPLPDNKPAEVLRSEPGVTGSEGLDTLNKKVVKKRQTKQRQNFIEQRADRRGKEVHMALSDAQVPDQDEQTYKSIYKFIKDLAPDVIHLNGDMMNCSTISSYGTPAGYGMTLNEEITETKKLIKKIVTTARKANPDAKVLYYEGNHEERLQRYMNKNAREIADVEKDDERVNTIPYLLGLKEMGVEWVGYWETRGAGKEVDVYHGTKVRSKSGYTAHANLEKRGKSTITGHTHRAALVMKTMVDRTVFGMELGSTCKREMKLPYERDNDWQQAIAVFVVDKTKKNEITHPTLIPIINHEFTFGTKIYKP